jgi:apolipoprotein D and lipocalin family protein
MPSLDFIHALLLSALSVCAVAVAQAESPPAALHTVDHVDLPRYMGRWYVISHVPNFLEKNKVNTSDNYALKDDGTIAVTFVFRKASLDAPEKSWKGTGWVQNKTSEAEWDVRLFWPLKSSYRVLELDPNYQWVVASTEDGKLFWVMARTPTISVETYRMILDRIRAQGLDPAKLEKVLQPSS